MTDGLAGLVDHPSEEEEAGEAEAERTAEAGSDDFTETGSEKTSDSEIEALVFPV